MAPRTADHPIQDDSKLRRIEFRWWWVLIAVVAVGALALSARLIASSPASVDRVSIVNNSVYDINVDLTGASGGGHLPLGTVAANKTVELEDVVDPGPTWILHFNSQGRDGGEVELSRDDIRRANWQIVIPETVADRLHADGAPPSAK